MVVKLFIYMYMVSTTNNYDVKKSIETFITRIIIFLNISYRW